MKKIIIVLLITLMASVLLNIALIGRVKSLLPNYNGFENSISIMVYDEIVGDYIKTDEIPKGLYMLNDEKTICTAGGTISGYNAFAGSLRYDLNTSDECYVYFDTIFYATDAIKRYYISQGVNDLYFHDESLPYGANDSSYRYAGSNPSNYVCFDGDNCTDENNLYRIIGVFGDRIKLIKYTNETIKEWNNSNNNTWQNSSLERYLNGTYLTSLGTKADLIDDTVWSVDGIKNADMAYGTSIKSTYDIEMNNSKTLTRKIGLMYIHEYAYAAPQNYWSKSISEYSPGNGYIWMWGPNWPWTITRDSNTSTLAFFVHQEGSVSDYSSLGNTVTYNSRNIYPTFNLKSDAKIIFGNGTKTEPFIIGS